MKKKIIISFFIVILFASLYFSYSTYPGILKNRNTISERKKKSALLNLEDRMRKKIAGFKGETAILIKDLDDRWQFSYKQDKLFPSASVVKIPIMLACFYAANEGKINLEEEVRLKNSDKVPGSGILKNMSEGRKFTPTRLIELMIVESDNTAANMLIERLGLDYLNSCFKRLGLKDTNISRKMMHFKYRKQGIENYTTAQDIAYILEKIYRQELLSKDISIKCLQLLKRQKIKDRIPSRLPHPTVVANKTGLERGVCHDAGIVFTPKGNFLICVFTRHKYKTARIPKAFIAWLSQQVYNFYQNF